MSGTENFNDYPKHPGPTTPRPYYVEIPLETFETMSKELAELRKNELAWDLDKARIKELEAENESLKYSVATLDTDIAMMKRWRKVSEELPQNGQDVWAYDSRSKSILLLEYEKSDEGEGFIVFQYKHDFLQNITQWMPFKKPKAPEETEK